MKYLLGMLRSWVKQSPPNTKRETRVTVDRQSVTFTLVEIDEKEKRQVSGTFLVIETSRLDMLKVHFDYAVSLMERGR